MDCKNCADNGMSIPAHKVLNGVPYCELCLDQLNDTQPEVPPVSVPPTPKPVGRLTAIAERDEEENGDQPAEEETTTMPVKKERSTRALDIDWSKVQKDRDSGMTLATLTGKYGVSLSSLMRYTVAPKGGAPRGPRPQRAAVSTPPAKAALRVDATSAALISSQRYKDLKADLEAKRDEITRALETLESLKHLI